MTQPERIEILREGDANQGNVIYWMSRDQRVDDNWAMIHAIDLATRFNSGLAVVFCLVKDYRHANPSHFKFMIDGLKIMEKKLHGLNIPFALLRGNPTEELEKYIHTNQVGHVVTDFDPLKIKRKWKNDLIGKTRAKIHEVDAHNIVPCKHVSTKQEFAAYTLRPKINRLLPEFLVEFPRPGRFNSNKLSTTTPVDWREIDQALNMGKAKEYDWIKPGSNQAVRMMHDFINKRLDRYAEDRNNPNLEGTSRLSPYLHFGQLSAQRLALEVKNSQANTESKEAFLEELIVRRELSDNFCHYNENHDNFEGFPDWAKKTLNDHRKDEREYLYHPEEFENAATGDPLWNAAQVQLTTTGRMHGYMRMYWAKKILEWTKSPEQAMEISIYLNDKYQLDGRDPNGLVGCAWSIGGVHDRAWTERPVFGKIRYMNYNGCKRKFDIRQYMEQFH